MQSECSKSSGRRRAESVPCTTRTSVCSTRKTWEASVCPRSILLRLRRRGRVGSGLFQARISSPPPPVRSSSLSPTNLLRSSSSLSSSLLPLSRQRRVCPHRSQPRSSEYRARSPGRPASQNRPKTSPRRRANAALSCSFRSCIYPFPYHIQLYYRPKRFLHVYGVPEQGYTFTSLSTCVLLGL